MAEIKKKKFSYPMSARVIRELDRRKFRVKDLCKLTEVKAKKLNKLKLKRRCQ